MARFMCYEEEGDAGVTREACDAQTAAEEYVEAEWEEDGYRGENRTVRVRDGDGVATVWDVETNAIVEFTAVEFTARPHEDGKAE
jgi:hypothetical protein